MSDSQPPFKSSYPPLKVPDGGWKSAIPEHLLADADPATKWIMEEMSKNSQAIEWACHGLVDTNEQVRKTNGRLLKAEAELTEAKGSVVTLNEKATVMEPLFKPLSQFMSLWDYKWFRVICYIALFFFFTYALPFYLQHPISLDSLFSLLTGS